MKKLTNVTALEMVLALEEVKGNKELFEKLETMKAQFDKKNKSATGDKKPTKAQLENEKIKEVILECVGETPKMIKELQAEFPQIGTDKFTNQKLSALLKQLVSEEKVVRTEEKGKALFSKIVVDNE